jgi:SOS-response transcriptional repressor LexA
MRYGLTPKQQRVFDFLKNFSETHYRSPSQQETATALQLGKQSVQVIYAGLRERGWIDWIPSADFSVTILPDTTEYFPSQYQPGPTAAKLRSLLETYMLTHPLERRTS